MLAETTESLDLTLKAVREQEQEQEEEGAVTDRREMEEEEGLEKGTLGGGGVKNVVCGVERIDIDIVLFWRRREEAGLACATQYA